MRHFLKHITILQLLFAVQLCMGQISPGKLSNAHADLEGISNCTQCHELGDRVTDQKCLACHTEINDLIRQDRGFHASSQVVSQDCVKCHSEHHGRNFDMVRFDTDNFNHDLTGYTLEGAHESVDCRECHQANNISNPIIRKREDTFLGLETDCLSCHDDFHQGQFSTNCLQCHTMEAFSPVTNFDHDQTDFPLRGEHAVVDCKECHQTVVVNGRETQQFSNLEFADCKACHQDPHNNQLPGTCTQCHVETSFEAFRGQGRFNHNRTGFELKGKHRTIDCFSCHAETSSPTQVFQDRAPVDASNCVACHADPHDNMYGQDCAQCHSEESFTTFNKNMDFFDHSVTDFDLEGMHVGVDCRECHKERFSTPIDFSECKNCHEDYHNGEFEKNGMSPDCKECHTLDKGFEFTTFTITDHEKSDFPLEGAHVATPCFACHVDEASDRWTFANLGTSCVDCHNNIHEDYLDPKFIPNNDCTSCHGSDTWDMVNFDHSQTNWELTGQHMQVSCSECHFEISDTNELISQKFSNLGTDCASCHDNVHGSSFEINGITECSRCHVTTSWFPEKFDHDTTRFPLTGRHEEVDCRLCHEATNDEGEEVIIYKLNKLNCIDCHS